MISSNSPINKQERLFQRLALLTVLVIYLLILAGGIVRGTGSGMGCPDWPTCFGRWVPPTEAAQLPPNYQEIYGVRLKGEVKFNAVKTWIEYVNRLLGVLSGFFVLGTLLASVSYLRKDQSIFWGSLVAFLMIGVNGWLGSRVVATELAHYMVTLHLVLALVVVFALLFVWVRANASYFHLEPAVLRARALRPLLLIVMGLTFIQVILGTEVRGSLDAVVKRLGYGQRADWIGQLTESFYFHRSFSLLVLFAHILVIYRLRRTTESGLIAKLAKALLGLVIAEIGTGIVMAYFGVPAIAQPIHLELAVLLMGLQFVTWLTMSSSQADLLKRNSGFQLVKV